MVKSWNPPLKQAEDAIYLTWLIEVVEKLNQKPKNICKNYKNDELDGCLFFIMICQIVHFKV